MKRTDTRDAGNALRQAGIRYDRAFTDKRKTTGPRTKFYGIRADLPLARAIISECFPFCRVAVVEGKGGTQSVVVWR